MLQDLCTSLNSFGHNVKAWAFMTLLHNIEEDSHVSFSLRLPPVWLPCPGITSCNSIHSEVWIDAVLWSPCKSDPDIITDKNEYRCGGITSCIVERSCTLGGHGSSLAM